MSFDFLQIQSVCVALEAHDHQPQARGIRTSGEERNPCCVYIVVVVSFE